MDIATKTNFHLPGQFETASSGMFRGFNAVQRLKKEIVIRGRKGLGRIMRYALTIIVRITYKCFLLYFTAKDSK